MRLMMAVAGVVLVLGGAILAGSASGGTSTSMPLPLKVVGAQVLNSKGEPVILRGVNCASMEWTSDGQGHILQSARAAIDDWHVNHIRLPLAQDRWFGKAPEQKDEGKAYRTLVKEVVDLCASKGCYIILDLHWSDVGEWGTNIGQHSMPDENSLAFWKDLAPVYANHPAVIYDLYNEPHDVTWDFHPQAGPTLISDWNYTPTPDFGVFVKQMLSGTLPRYTPPTVPAAAPQPKP